MKNQNISILSIIILFIIILLLLFTRENSIQICCNTASEPPISVENCNKKGVPRVNDRNQLEQDDVVLYYKIDDNCNFQTLFLDVYRNSRVSNRRKAFTILGRFNGKSLSNGKYQINTIEMKAYELPFDKEPTTKYRISGVKLAEDSSSNNIKILMEMKDDTNITRDDKSDYVYGLHDNEKPIILDVNARMNFYIMENIEEKNKNDDDGDGNSRPTSGGYECNGIAITSGNG